MKRFLIIGMIAGVIAALALVAVLAAGVVTYRIVTAQTQPDPQAPADGFGPGMMGRGFGMMGRGGGFGGGMMGRGTGGYGPMHEYMLAAVADGLGLSAEELQERMTAGETMWEIASSTGLTDDEVTTLMAEARTEALNQMVADGVITQAQANWMIERMGQMNQNGFGPCHGGAPGRGRWNRPAQ